MQTYHCIVLSTLRYKDNDLIVKAFSREIGLVSFIHRGAYKSKKGSTKSAFYQVLSQNLVSTSAKNNDLKKRLGMLHQIIFTRLCIQMFLNLQLRCFYLKF